MQINININQISNGFTVGYSTYNPNDYNGNSTYVTTFAPTIEQATELVQNVLTDAMEA